MSLPIQWVDFTAHRLTHPLQQLRCRFWNGATLMIWIYRTTDNKTRQRRRRWWGRGRGQQRRLARLVRISPCQGVRERGWGAVCGTCAEPAGGGRIRAGGHPIIDALTVGLNSPLTTRSLAPMMHQLILQTGRWTGTLPRMNWWPAAWRERPSAARRRRASCLRRPPRA